MDETTKVLYDQYKAAGNTETEEQFLDAKALMGDEEFTAFINSQIDVKKKGDTQVTPENLSTDGSATNTASSPTVVPEIITEQFQGTPQNQTDLRFEESVSQPIAPSENSTVSDSILGNDSSVSVSISPDKFLPKNNAQTPKIFKNEKDSFSFLAGKPSDEEVVIAENQPVFEAGKPSEQEIKNTNEFLIKYADKDYLNKDIPEVSKGLPYFGWSQKPEDVQNSNTNLLAAEQVGDVALSKNEDGSYKTDDKGNIQYEILTDGYLNTFNNYIRDLNSAANNDNVDRARYNQGNTDNTPQQTEDQNYTNEIFKEYGVLVNDEQLRQLSTAENRRDFENNLEAQKLQKENPQLDFNTALQQVVSRKPDNNPQQLIQTGRDYVQEMLIGGDGTFDSYYADGTQDERNFYERYFDNPQNVAAFGQYMEDEGKAVYDTSWIRRNNVSKNQEKRKELFESFLAWRGKEDRLNYAFSKKAYQDAELKAEAYSKEKNTPALARELDEMAKYEAQMNASKAKINGSIAEFDSAQQFYSKTNARNREKEDFQIRVQNDEILANAENMIGNVLLGAETSLQKAATGLLRIGATPFGKGNVNDAIDILSEPISVGRVDIARISDDVVNYSAGNKKYREINGNLYEVDGEGKISRPKTQVDRSQLTETSRDRDVNVSGLAFVTSKMLADIYITQRVGGGINGKFAEAANAVNNSKKIASVFGEGSQIAKQAASFARVAKGADANMITGWTVQMYNDNYLAAKNGGIESEAGRHLYAFTTSFALAQIQRINPDTNFLKSVNSEYKSIVSALMENNTQKAIIALQSFATKAATNTSKELVEENVQQGTQDVTNLVVNTLGNKDIQISTVNDYKDVFTGTVVPSIILSAFGGSASRVDVGGRKIDLTALTRNELVTELARTEEGLKLLQDFRDNAFFDSQQEEAEKLVQEVELRQKYIKKIPDADQYSTETINAVIPVLQEIDRKNRDKKNDDGVFTERINAEVSNLSTEVNNLLDQDKNAETAQPTPQPEAAQEQGNLTENQPEQTPSAGLQESGVTNPNTTQNETQINPVISESVAATIPDQSLNTPDADAANIETTQSENPENTQIQIDETVFSDSVNDEDLSDEQVASVKNQIDNSVSVFESLNEPETAPAEVDTPQNINRRPSANGKYTIAETVSPEGRRSFELFDKKNKPAKLTDKQKEVYVAEYINAQEYPATELDLADGMSEEDLASEIIAKSTNPIEIAQVIATTPRFDSGDVVGSKDWAIAQVIGKNNVSRESFIQFGDRNNINNSIGNAYFGKNKGGRAIDTIAQDASEVFAADYSGDSITPQDIIDFILKYPGDPSKAERPNNPVYDAAREKFIQLTGQVPRKNLLDKLIPANKNQELNLVAAEAEYDLLNAEAQNALTDEYNEWFNFLPLDQKITELQKTFYENDSTGNPEEESGENDNQPVPDGSAESNQDVGNEEIAAFQRQPAGSQYARISTEAFADLIERLKKPFAKAFKNLNVTTDWNAFQEKANAIGAKVNFLSVFHGSPHTFDKFSTSAMGTGEGAQAFGWGLYFTDLKEIAEGYANRLSPNIYTISGVDVKASDMSEDYQNAVEDIIFLGYDVALNKAKQLNQENIVREIEKLDGVPISSKKASRNLYEVKIHGGRSPEQYNWLEWDKFFNQNKTFLIIQDEQNLSKESKFELSRIRLKENEIGQKQALRQAINDYKALLKTKDGESYGYDNIMTPEIRSRFATTIEELQNILNYKGDFINFKNKTGSSIYQELIEKIGSDKGASLFLLENGIDGIKYPAESVSRGVTSDNARGFNYVVFDENAIEIDSRIQFMHTASGQVYGAKLPDGTVYINPENLNANTPIHEFSHLWEQIMPLAWKKGLDFFRETKTGKDLFARLQKDGNYSNLTEDQLWSEAMNTHIGNIGEQRYQNPKGKMKEFVDWFKTTMAKLLNTVGIKNNWTAETNLSNFTDTVLNDLLGGKELTPEGNVSDNSVQFSINRKAMPKSTFAAVANATSQNGRMAGYEELTKSSWYNALTDAAKERITPSNFQNTMIEQAKIIQDNLIEARKKTTERANNKIRETTAKVKQEAKEKIADIVADYRQKMKDLKADTSKDSREKVQEQRRVIRTAVKEIKSHLADNLYVGKITPTEANRLIRKASEIGARKDVSKAVTEFKELYDKVQAKAESRLKQKEFSLDEYNELKPIVSNLKNNGATVEEVLENVKGLVLSNKKKDVLNTLYTQKIRDVYAALNGENMTADQAYEQMKAKQQEVSDKMADNRTKDQKIKEFARKAIKYISDRQYLPKKLLQEIQADNTKSRMIAMAGASSRARMVFDELNKNIFEGLKLDMLQELNAMIVAKRNIAIEKNRAERNLPPAKHPYANSQKALEGMKQRIGEDQYKDLENRSAEYFKAFKELLTEMRNNGLISQEGYESMIEIDYQPRVFIDRLLDADGNLDPDGNFQNFSGQNGGLKSEIVKALGDGSDSAIIDNAEWLLKTALASRFKAMAMNEVNRRFMTDEFFKAKDRFAAIDPQNFNNKEEKRFYNYFKELQAMIIDNPIVGMTDTGKPKYKYDTAPQGFKKAYYYVDGTRNEFFLAEEFHQEWHDVKEGYIFTPKAKGIVNTYSGAGLIKAMATGYNPTFFIANTPRDFMQTLVFSPEYSTNLVKGTFQLAADEMKAVVRMYKQDFMGKEDATMQKYLQYGGGMDFLYVQGLIERDNKTKKAIDKVLDSKVFETATLMKLSKWSEMMTRMAIFERSIKNQLKEAGLKSIDEVTDQQTKDDIYYRAVDSARSIMDFNQGGKAVKDLDAIMPYLNAATQGTRVAIDAFRDRPGPTALRMFQAAGLMASTAIGVSYALFAAAKGLSDDEEEKKKSSTESILDAYDGLSQYQRANYINIVLPSKNDKGEHQILKIAKTQFVAPLSYLMEEGLLGTMRRSVGRKEKDFTDSMKETLWVANKNMTPIEFASPEKFVTSVATKNPLMKASLTYVTGYDFFKDEFVTFDVKKSNFPKQLEGYKDQNVEDFYKSFGKLTDRSPARTKAFVESIVTTPETNPFVTVMYGGADLTNAVIQGDSKAEVAQEIKENMGKVLTKRLIGAASDFNRQQREREKVNEEVEKAILKDEKLKIETDILAKKITDKKISINDAAKEIKKMNLTDDELLSTVKRITKKTESKASDNRIYDIMYSTSTSNRAKAILIKNYFPEVYENTIEGQAIRQELKQFKLFGDKIQKELIKIQTGE